MKNQLLTLITAIGLVAAALATPSAMAQTATECSGNTPILVTQAETVDGVDYVVGDCRQADPAKNLGGGGQNDDHYNPECEAVNPLTPYRIHEYASTYRWVVGGNPTRIVSDIEAGDTRAEADRLTGGCRVPLPGWDDKHIPGYEFDESGPNACTNLPDSPGRIWTPYPVRGENMICKAPDRHLDCILSKGSPFIPDQPHYVHQDGDCIAATTTEHCQMLFSDNMPIAESTGLCVPAPLEVTTAIIEGTDGEQTDGTEDSPYVASDEDFAVTVDVMAGSQSVIFTPIPEDSSPELAIEINEEGVVMVATTVTTGMYTIAVMASDEAVNDDGTLNEAVVNSFVQGGSVEVVDDIVVPDNVESGLSSANVLANVLAAAEVDDVSNHREVLMIHITVAGVASPTTPNNDDTLIATTAESSSNHKPIAVAGLFMAGIFLVNYLYGWETAKTSWTPSYAYRQNNGNIAYSIGSRWTTTADNMRFYWQTRQNGGSNGGKFIYGSGMSYNNGILAAAINSESDSTITDMDLSLSANKTMGMWTLGGGYNFDMELSETESETKNRVDISANYTQNQWVLSAAAMQIHGTDTESQNRLNIAARYTVDKWILSANANTNGEKTRAAVNYSYRF